MNVKYFCWTKFIIIIFFFVIRNTELQATEININTEKM